ncbi:MAG: general secretion pathway protein GspF [Gammaproteobacteria bacterium]|nr:MAG: general secretion pathway protein GspF [Gammaproteobacteria bacterium]
MARRKQRNYFEPQRHPDHPRPITRRQLIAQGFLTGAATVTAGGIFSLFANPRAAMAALSPDLQAIIDSGRCPLINPNAFNPVPFICFDLAGGANMAGSNVLVGGQGGQLDFLTTAGYGKLGLPGDMVPGVAEAAPTATSNGDHTDTSLGLGFHSDSAFLRGMQASLSPGTAANVNGAVIPARSENDTSNNPHNPMYGIARAGGEGELLTLIGSRASESGGNSMDPVGLIDPELRATWRPTKVDRPSDVTGLVDTGDLIGLLGQNDAVAVMESIERLSAKKMDVVDPKLGSITANDVLRDLVKCGYLKAADVADRFGDQSVFDVLADTNIVGPTGIFSSTEFNADREFQKTASIMKLVLNGYAGAGCITMGGYDYHGGRRAEGEVKDFRAGRCMGACLEYAARVGSPLMMYVFSDGSLSSNGVIDESVDGRGKGEWTSDNQSTAASFFLVYNPGGRPILRGVTPDEQARHQQIGWFRPEGSVETAASPAANNVNLLVETVVLNYLALRHADPFTVFQNLFPNNGLGSIQLQQSLTAFQNIV